MKFLLEQLSPRKLLLLTSLSMLPLLSSTLESQTIQSLSSDESLCDITISTLTSNALSISSISHPLYSGELRFLSELLHDL